jgi:hypothetical protein
MKDKGGNSSTAIALHQNVVARSSAVVFTQNLKIVSTAADTSDVEAVLAKA